MKFLPTKPRPLTFIAALGLALALTVAVTAQSFAASWRLLWDDPNPAGSVASYRVYRVTGMTTNTATTPPTITTNWALLASPTTPAWPIANLAPGLHTLAVSAVGTSGLESDRSTNAIVGLIVAVVNLRVTSP